MRSVGRVGSRAVGAAIGRLSGRSLVGRLVHRSCLLTRRLGNNRDKKSAKSRQRKRKKIDQLVGRSVGQSNRSVGQSGVHKPQAEIVRGEENGRSRRQKE